MRTPQGLDNACTRVIKVLHSAAHQIPSVPPSVPLRSLWDYPCHRLDSEAESLREISN